MICNIRNIVLVVILTFFMISCKNELKNDSDFIEKLSHEIDEEMPLISESIIILIKSDNKIYISSIRTLFEEYSKNYKTKYSFEDFIDMVINDNMFNKEQMENISVHNFKVDNNIANLYGDKGLNYLISEYCEKTNKNNTLFLKQNLNLEVQFNIMYYFFKNNYFLLEDDYEGRFILINKN